SASLWAALPWPMEKKTNETVLQTDVQGERSVKLAVHGAAGRMGQRVIALAVKDPRFQVVAALESADHPLLGKDAGLLAGVGEIGVPLGVMGESNADVVVDFSVPDAAVAVIAHCVGALRPVV